MKKKYILLLLLLLLFIHIIIMIKVNKIETFLDNRIELHDWWEKSDNNDTFIQKICSGVIDKYDKINVYSVFGNTEVVKNPKQLNIQLSGESRYRDTNLFDINLIPEPIDKRKNIINFPFSTTYALTENIDLQKLIIPRTINKIKTNFCLFSVSNCSCEQRNQMFKELSKYKFVDSCGSCMNNSAICPNNYISKEYHEFINNYKFMICFENTSERNYFTEKLIISFLCGTIPIYWGCPNIEEYINMDAILYLPPNYTEKDMNELIEKIKYLDNNQDAYKLKYEKYLFKNGIIPDCFDIHKLKLQIDNVLQQS